MDTINLRTLDDIQQYGRNYNSLEDKGLNYNKSQLHRMKSMHTRYSNTKEQQTLNGKYRGLITEAISYREIDERQHIENY
jgi:hypothetical protein